MSEDTLTTTSSESTSLASPSFEGESVTGEEWKTGSEAENDKADLSSEETLEVDNWLLNQGIDSGGQYVEKLSETISQPVESFESSEEQNNLVGSESKEEEIISPRIIEYFEKQDPELIMDSLSTMTDDELDQAIELIETGEVEGLREVFEKKPEIELEFGVVSMPTPTEIPVKNKRSKMAWESDPRLPDFTKIDTMRRAELKSLLKEHRVSSQKINTKSIPATETILSKDLTTDEEVIFETQKSPENREKQKASGIVAYDIPSDALLRDVKIVLVERPDSESWTLPQTVINPDAKNEQRETEKRILELYGIKIEIEEKIVREKKTLIKTDISEITSEKNYYMAESDSTKPLIRDDMKWVTLADIQTKDFELTEDDLDTIATAVKIIKQKMESEAEHS